MTTKHLKHYFLCVYIGLLFLPCFAYSKSTVELKARAMTKDSTTQILVELWSEMHRAETLLLLTSRSLNKERADKIFEDVHLERPLLILLIRMTSSLDPEQFSAQDYLIRYPFSSVTGIQEALDELINLGFAEKLSYSDDYRISLKGKSLVEHWMIETGRIIETLDLGAIPYSDLLKLIEFDNSILKSIAGHKTASTAPIFYNRLKGMQPNYEELHLWHHWQRVWSMLSALKDEEEKLRKQLGLSPIAWKLRRQLWLNINKPWLTNELNVEKAAKRLQYYAPVDKPVENVNNAVEELQKSGWLKIDDSTLALTQKGLNAHTKDEETLTLNFIQLWPKMTNDEIMELLELFLKLNSHLETLKVN